MSKTDQGAELSCMKIVLYGATNLFLFIAGSANLIAGTIAAFQGSSALAATSLTAALVLLFAATIDRFESLKGLGIEAKTRQLDQKLSQADEAMEKLRQMTELTGAHLVSVKCSAGRWGGAASAKELVDFSHEIRKMMRSLGSSESVINDTLEPWALTMCRDMASLKVAELQAELHNRASAINTQILALNDHTQQTPSFVQLKEQYGAIKAFTDRISNLYQFEMNDYPDKFLALFDNVPSMTIEEVKPYRDSAESIVSDMISLKQNRILKSPDVWIDLINQSRGQ